MMTTNLLPILDARPSSKALSFAPIEASSPTAAMEASKALPARLATLGCKVNQYETDYVRELLLANGYRDALPDEPAALAVVNTCTVTAHSDKKSRQLIRGVARKNPGVKIVVMGCYATADPEAVRRLPGVAAVVEDKRDLAGALHPFGVRKKVVGVKSFVGRQRAFIKVQDGCILNCTFCIIPKVRPGLLSRTVDEIADEVRGAVEAGYREIVLTGIHLGHYGVDLSQGLPRRQWRRLWHLLDRLANLPGEFRIRLSSLEATEVTDDFAKVLADHPTRICPHLHLSMQSGSDRILQRMKRRYRIGKFLGRCEKIRARLDEPAFTTDVIVGFPGETETDFEQTMQACRDAGFSRIHVFPFSARQGTEAEHFSDGVPADVAADRGRRLSELAQELAWRYYQRLVGRRLEMLIESPAPDSPGIMRGTACRYAPLRLATLPSLSGRLVPVLARRTAGDALEVEPAWEDLGLDAPQVNLRSAPGDQSE